MADMAEQVRYEIWKATEAAGQGVKPWWDVVMYALWRVFAFLLIALCLSWLFAGVCAKEGMYALHKQSRRAFAVILLSVAAIVLTNFLLMAVSAGFGPLGLTLVAATETFIAYKVVTWLVPDFRPALGNEPRRGGFDGQYPQLPG
jgi:fatty acid desaturase